MTAERPALIPVIRSAWPLFFGVVLLLVGNGLQGTLLSLRATSEGFDIVTTGIILSMYYAGYLAGSILAPGMLVRVGHIRVFAALASLASSAVLLHYVFVDPWIWGVTRIFTGFAYAGLYVVIESWLNGISTNRTRGKILSLYMFLVYLGLMLGQLLLNVADPEGAELFILTSILVSLALLPIALSRRAAPEIPASIKAVKLRELYKISPVGVIGAGCAGLLSASLFAMAPVYATTMGMSLPQVSVFMAVMVCGGMVMQYPVGMMSDKIDRRAVIAFCCIAAGIMAVLCHFIAGHGLSLLFFICAFLFWGFSTPLYALAASHTNDHLRSEQIVPASGALILTNGIGAILGPVIFSLLLTVTGNERFFIIFATAYAVITAYVVYRSLRRAAVPASAKGEFISLSDVNTPVSAQLIKTDPD